MEPLSRVFVVITQINITFCFFDLSLIDSTRPALQGEISLVGHDVM